MDALDPTIDPMHVLVSLHKGYGLGDAVQMSAVLRHVAKYNPHWVIDYQAEEGRHCVGQGIVANTFAYGTRYPTDRYDAEVQICLYNTWHNWTDRPNTHVSSALYRHFGMNWDAACGRYFIKVSDGAARSATVMTSMAPCGNRGEHENRVVAVHYQGDTARHNKDLTHAQGAAICKWIEKFKATPLLLDWRNSSPLPDGHTIRTTGRVPPSKDWGTDAEMNCAVISQCAAFVGIDSGPAKCASATETPSLVVWTGHHPAQFHDPAPNTTHLVPIDYHLLKLVNFDKEVVEWFEAHYNFRYYVSDPILEIVRWLKEVLNV